MSGKITSAVVILLALSAIVGAGARWQGNIISRRLTGSTRR